MTETNNGIASCLTVQYHGTVQYQGTLYSSMHEAFK